MSTKTESDVVEQTAEDVAVPGKYKVILFNDDKTTYAFVVEVLKHIFHKTYEEAVRITEMIHLSGSGIAGIYSREIAEEKALEVVSAAQRNGFPLKASAEPF